MLPKVAFPVHAHAFRPLPVAGLVAILLALMIGVALVQPARAAPSIVVEARTGKIVSQHQATDRWYPASLTKLMTVYTVFREVGKGRIGFKSPVKVTPNALAEPPSKMGFPVGTVMTVDTAIKILMVKSANDIATATAESVGGSEAAFIAMMNANAARLGMTDTHFVNAHGLHDPRQYTSARDMAVLAMAIRKEFPNYAKYFTIQAIKAGKRRLSNHNPLLFRFDGTTGMKTGFTCASGLNIVVSAKRGFRELVAVVLGGPTGQERNVRAAVLLTEGFKKNLLFTKATIDDLKASALGRRQPVDIRETVCTRKKKQVPLAKAITSANTMFAMKAPTLDDLEAKYLKPQVAITRIEPIALGDASGPDPFNLLGTQSGGAASAVTAFAETGDGKWPMVFGTRNVKVPVPEPSPRRKSR